MSSKTIYHNHHIIPKHMGGTDDPSNLVRLTVEEHAEAHRNLYEEYGRWQDYLAWKALSGQIKGYDLYIEKLRLSATGRKHTEETKKKISNIHKGRKWKQSDIDKRANSNRGKKRKPRSKEWCEAISKSRKGQSIKRSSPTEETKKRISESKRGHTYNKGREFPKVCCVVCSKEIAANRISVHIKSGKCIKDSKLHNTTL